jgi:hypothetical protein
MRNNLEYVNYYQVKNMNSKELYNTKRKKIKHPLDLKLVMTIGDQWGDVNGMNNVLGLKLPETYDMNAYFMFNNEIRPIQ